MFSFTQTRQDLEKLLEVYQGDLATVRTGRAKPSLVENIMVEAYGAQMRMMEVASIAAPDSSSIVIKPWDGGVLSAIEKAINMSDLHLQPVVDGQQVRINIPPLTGERRQELVKLVAQKRHGAEDMLRDVRTKYKKQIDGQKGQPGISEDNIKQDLEQLQKIHDEYMKRIEEATLAKEQELQTV